MQLLAQLLSSLPQGEVLEVRIGTHWTAVVVEVDGELRCGLCSTLFEGHNHHARSKPNIPKAGYLQDSPAQDLASMARGDSLSLRSVGIATLNALLPQQPELWEEANAEQIIARHGEGRRVVMVGHFPFVERLRSAVGELIVLEQNPRPDDLPAEAAPEVIPHADVIAITAMTLTNHTLEGLLELCSPETFVILMGPSTPLNKMFFNYGVDVLSGAVVTDIERVLRVVSQGGNFRQVHLEGVRLVNIMRPKSVNF